MLRRKAKRGPNGDFLDIISLGGLFHKAHFHLLITASLTVTSVAPWVMALVLRENV